MESLEQKTKENILNFINSCVKDIEDCLQGFPGGNKFSERVFSTASDYLSFFTSWDPELAEEAKDYFKKQIVCHADTFCYITDGDWYKKGGEIIHPDAEERRIELGRKQDEQRREFQLKIREKIGERLIQFYYTNRSDQAQEFMKKISEKFGLEYCLAQAQESEKLSPETESNIWRAGYNWSFYADDKEF